ncbi:helix-turn-helix transcriptional regulator [Lacrimispora sp.]|uniref:helix-turn-helix domain-containing protein n=1 Tax=Lacrimispora sp. TaxID=2719234 RepID=UPI0029E00FBD|nr:putative transcriptional regulator [Lacrimispora sp.]
MAFSYTPLWVILIERKMTKEDLRKKIHASPTTIAAMGRGEGISPKVLGRICETLNLQPGDIMTYIPENFTEAITFEPPESYEKP